MDNPSMNISSAVYQVIKGKRVGVSAVVDNKNMSVPLDPANRHYAEILRQVEAGKLTIADPE